MVGYTRYCSVQRNHPYHLRVSTVLDWLSGDSGEKADLVTLYFSNVDSAGHDGGPDSLEVCEQW